MRALDQRWICLVSAVALGGVALVVGCSSDSSSSGGNGGAANGGAATSGGSASGGAPQGGLPGSGGASAGSAGAASGGAATGGSASGGSAGSTAGGDAGGIGGTAGLSGTAGTSGAAGASAGGAATLVTPIQRSATSYVLEFADTYFEVDPQVGARVTDVHLKGATNVLSPATVNSLNYGSTFWPSPQTWPWPPTDASSITNINDKPFTPSTDDTSMTLVGAAASAVKFSVTKKFKADLANQAVVATYTMIATAAGVKAAPWEITRLERTGVTFYPTGTAPVAGGSFALPATTTAAGCTWLSAPASAPTQSQKMTANGTGGWLAHAAGDWVLIKKFPDVASSAVATGEDEIEIYLDKDSNYMEVEQQGAYGDVPEAPGVDWTVTWYIRHLPSGVTATAGSQELVDFVKSVIQ